MRKALPIAAALVLALAGCGAQAPATEETAEPEVVEEAAEESADEGVSINWTEVSSADEAAKGAGFDEFGVPSSFKLGDLEFSKPSFAYAGGVAQATYETPATMVYIRKAVDTYTTPLSDRKVDEFPAQWSKIFEGVDVHCYGASRGAVTVATWTDDNESYAITFQGLGGDEMSMDSDELRTMVKGIQEANADEDGTQKKAEEKKEEKTEEAKSTLLSAADAEALVEKTCGGDCTSIDRVVTSKYGECWHACATDSKGTTYEYYVNNDGIYLISETASQANNASKEQKKDAKAEHYEGEPVTIFDSIYAEWHQMNDGNWYAIFVTYNGTQIFAQPAIAGSGWAFNAFADGTTYGVYYSEESTNYGEVGPAGKPSHWSNEDGTRWF